MTPLKVITSPPERKPTQTAYTRIHDALSRISTLSPREMETARLMAAGHPSKVIAFHLGISAKTVEGHRDRVMEKTGCVSLIDFGRLWEAALVESAGSVPGDLPGLFVARPVGEVAHA